MQWLKNHSDLHNVQSCADVHILQLCSPGLLNVAVAYIYVLVAASTTATVLSFGLTCLCSEVTPSQESFNKPDITTPAIQQTSSKNWHNVTVQHHLCSEPPAQRGW